VPRREEKQTAFEFQGPPNGSFSPLRGPVDRYYVVCRVKIEGKDSRAGGFQVIPRDLCGFSLEKNLVYPCEDPRRKILPGREYHSSPLYSKTQFLCTRVR